jgi:hypothetical protein
MRIGKEAISLISEAIRSAIETKLNNNTADEQFVVGSYAYLEDKDRDFIYNVRNGYKLIESNYIPCMMDFSVSYEPIPDVINGYATIGLTFLLSSDNQAEFESELEAVEELVAKVVGNDDSIVDGSTTYNAVWNMDALMPTGETKPLNGTYYTKIQTTVYITFSDTFYMLNRYKYYLGILVGEVINYTQIKAVDGNVIRNNTKNYPHKRGDREAKGGIDESAWVGSFSVNVDSFIETNILTKISTETYDLTEYFYYKETINDVNSHSFKVSMENISRGVGFGDFQMINFDLFKSDVE